MVSNNDISIPGYSLERWHPERKHESSLVIHISRSLNTKNSKKKKRQNLATPFPSIHIGKQSIMEVQYQKLMGVTIHNNLSWSQHMSATSKSISKKAY